MTDFREMPSGTRWPVVTQATTTAPGSGDWHVEQVSKQAPADSRELVPLVVKRGGDVVADGLSVSLSQRPDQRSWRPVDRDGDVVGVRLGGLARGRYVLAVRHASGVVLEAGVVRVT